MAQLNGNAVYDLVHTPTQTATFRCTYQRATTTTTFFHRPHPSGLHPRQRHEQGRHVDPRSFSFDRGQTTPPMSSSPVSYSVNDTAPENVVIGTREKGKVKSVQAAVGDKVASSRRLRGNPSLPPILPVSPFDAFEAP